MYTMKYYVNLKKKHDVKIFLRYVESTNRDVIIIFMIDVQLRIFRELSGICVFLLRMIFYLTKVENKTIFLTKALNYEKGTILPKSADYFQILLISTNFRGSLRHRVYSNKLHINLF